MSAKQSVDFCKELICEAKETLVSEDGIGSDIAPCIIAFDQNEQCLGWAQMAESATDQLDQYQRLTMVAGMMRAGWHAHGIALVVEGYMVTGDLEDDDKSLASLFASGDKSVDECISIIYGDASGSMLARSLPYRQELGRKVNWLTETTRDVGNEGGGSFIEVLQHLFKVVEMTPWPENESPSSCMTEIAAHMGEQGFMLVCGIPGTVTDWDL
jgi:hypothetical protein